MHTLKAGLLYFAVVFGCGFVLGIIRTLWIAPHVGTRWAELMEAPIMLAVTIVAARWAVRRSGMLPAPSNRLAMGAIAFSLMLTAEFSLVLRLRGLTTRDYLAYRDPVSGTVYYVLLALFAFMPFLLPPPSNPTSAPHKS